MADYSVKSDAKGNLNTKLTITDLITQLGIAEYSILRLVDETGNSGGILMDSLEPDGNPPDDDPYAGLPATMVMRAREDGRYGKLEFF